MKKKILVLGDITLVQWHSMKKIEETLKDIFHSYYEIVFSEDYPEISTDRLEEYDLCINYIDNWNERGTKQASDAIVSYVRNGGKLLTLHNGIILKSAPELLKMHGGEFTGHEEYCELLYSSTELQHEITKGIGPFAIYEEPYEFHLYSDIEKEIILQYERQGKHYPAAWVTHHERGQIVYLSPGHNVNTFINSSIQNLIQASVVWLLK